MPTILNAIHITFSSWVKAYKKSKKPPVDQLLVRQKQCRNSQKSKKAGVCQRFCGDIPEAAGPEWGFIGRDTYRRGGHPAVDPDTNKEAPISQNVQTGCSKWGWCKPASQKTYVTWPPSYHACELNDVLDQVDQLITDSVSTYTHLHGTPREKELPIIKKKGVLELVSDTQGIMSTGRQALVIREDKKISNKDRLTHGAHRPTRKTGSDLVNTYRNTPVWSCAAEHPSEGCGWSSRDRPCSVQVGIFGTCLTLFGISPKLPKYLPRTLARVASHPESNTPLRIQEIGQEWPEEYDGDLGEEDDLYADPGEYNAVDPWDEADKLWELKGYSPEGDM
ncbi:hypothetical protein HETIRDRAFT_118578 [Heterobasidion irregulare TC 32-1]|uniref:Uncharacterized protein n=1 Tax=Heterobasidion irregulare (strain TC 32-1) TaxID=747525 RepID=W4JUL1_HETIT|nr:uncharacterized protein HETIRDRAFT_118578 [Heterobasidion irregulare TC 32-1]ETW77159.1 hypothetical protein HETIRDRAFT_118578 [Heterobasidion irregulare TC 32-1]